MFTLAGEVSELTKISELNGLVYEGEWKDGQRHGRGTRTYANGGVYEGEYKDGQRQEEEEDLDRLFFG